MKISSETLHTSNSGSIKQSCADERERSEKESIYRNARKQCITCPLRANDANVKDTRLHVGEKCTQLLFSVRHRLLPKQHYINNTPIDIHTSSYPTHRSHTKQLQRTKQSLFATLLLLLLRLLEHRLLLLRNGRRRQLFAPCRRATSLFRIASNRDHLQLFNAPIIIEPVIFKKRAVLSFTAVPLLEGH